jgi:glutamyl-tRNA synthetase
MKKSEIDRNKYPVRLRIAPSPTGYLHLGTARTALFNYLFARANNGQFLLRIEDTDLKRSDGSMVDSIIRGLKWLGLKWDEEVLFQSAHFDEYKRKGLELYDNGLAYWCYCTPEEIKERKNRRLKSKKRWMYDRRCDSLSVDEKVKFEKEGRPKALRFRVDKGVTVFDDLIHGEIKRDNSEIEDFVLLKSDGSPAYNMSVVVDDHRMKISHILRGDDHISNTPKQIMLYRAFNWDIPRFGHMPLILSKDKTKLSKRKDAVDIFDYKKEGFFPEGMVNCLVLLGWSSKTEEEIFSLKELERIFDLENIHTTPGVFDRDKLEWINGEWLRKLGDDEVVKRLNIYLEDNEFGVYDSTYLIEVLKTMGNRVNKLGDFIEIGRYFFTDDFSYDEKGVKKRVYTGVEIRLEKLIEKFKELGSFNKENMEDALRKLSEELDCKAGELIHPVRLGVSGMTFGPGLFELLEVLGKEKVIKRLERFVDYIKKTHRKVEEK